MRKTILITGALITVSASFGFTAQRYNNANADEALRGFQVLPALTTATPGQRGGEPKNSLVIKHERQYSPDTQHYTTSYYQYYQGVRVLDGEITLHETPLSSSLSRGVPEKKVIGQLVRGIDISPADLAQLKSPEHQEAALVDAKTHFLKTRTDQHWNIRDDKAHVVIKKMGDTLAPLYEVSFYATAKNKVPVLYHALLDPSAHNKVVRAWNEVMRFTDVGPGGNGKTKKYYYGEDGIPAMNVRKKANRCVLEDIGIHLNVVDMSALNPNLEGYDFYKKPFSYQCNSEERDTEHFFGAYSPADDAYFFGHLVQEAYQNWYNTKVLNLAQMTLRVHYSHAPGEPMANAFWDPYTQTMNFGDGTAEEFVNEAVTVGGQSEMRSREAGFYPLVSIDIMAHEMSHGFTSAHANLQYHDESGCLNEAFSDMAGLAVVEYARTTMPKLYQALYHTPEIVWSTGSTIVRSANPTEALRYYDRPSRDGMSAECYESVWGCSISYNDILQYAYHYIDDEDDRQNFIVHLGSGVYNRFFYTLARTPGWDIKKAFGLMLKCNRDGYWTENTDFELAACQTLLAASDLAYDVSAVRSAFATVGLSTVNCATAPG